MSDEAAKIVPMSNIMEEVHEDRIQKLEVNISDLKTQHAETATTLRFLGQQLSESTATISAKIDTYTATISGKIEHVEAVVGEHGSFIAISQADQAKTRAKWESWKKWVTTAMAGVTAIALKESVTLIIHKMP